MYRLSRHLAALTVLLFFASSCATFSPHFRKLQPNNSKPKKGEAVAAMAPIKKHQISNLPKSRIQQINEFMIQYDAAVVGLMALFALWMFVRAYESQKRRRIVQLSRLDIALLRVARSNINRMWERHRPGHNVVKLDDWRE